MKNNNWTNAELRDLIKKGLDLSFKKLLKFKRQTGGFLVLYENGEIKKVKAIDIID